MVNIETSDTENIIGTVKRTLPAHMVAIQFRIFTPVGTAMNMVVAENAATDTGPMPAVNMWWAHTPQPMKPIAAPDRTTIGYPNRGLRLNTGSVSETTPNAGRIRMYTSGCPNIQNRCCHSNGSAPAVTSKKFESKVRSKVSSTSATVMTGSANTSRNCTTRIIHVKTGMRSSVMPGQRMLIMVTSRFSAPSSEAMPAICKPRA